jgi:hypothetical protein
MAEFLGDAFIVEIFHNPSADGQRIYPSLKGKGRGYNITGPATGESKTLDIPAPVSELKAFFWDGATKEDWDSIYIPGEYPARKDEKTGEVTTPARSKNVIQARIKEALNWKEHPLSARSDIDTPPAQNRVIAHLPSEDEHIRAELERLRKEINEKIDASRVRYRRKQKLRGRGGQL